MSEWGIDRIRNAGPLGEKVAAISERIRDNFEVALTKVTALATERKTNFAYYNGKQVARTEGLLWGGLGDDTDVQPQQVPMLRKLTEDRISQMVDAPPKYEAIAISGQQTDVTDAAIVTQACEANWHHYELPSKIMSALKLASIMSTSFVKVSWDYSAGRVGADGKPVGDVCLTALSPFRVIPDPLAHRLMPERKDEHDARFLWEVELVDTAALVGHKQWSKGQRGDKTSAGNVVFYGGVPFEDDLKTCDSAAVSPDEQETLEAGGRNPHEEMSGASTWVGKDNKKKGGKVKVAYYYEFPSEENDNKGRYAAYLPDNGWHVLEYREELPYATKDHPTGLVPFVQFVDIHVPGIFSGRCRMTEARDLQDALNKLFTRWQEIRDKMKPWIGFDLASGYNIDDIVDGGMFNVIPFDSRGGGQKPGVEFPPVYTELLAIQNEMVSLRRHMEDILDSHTVQYMDNQSRTKGEIDWAKQEDVTKIRSGDVARAELWAYGPLMKLVLRLQQRYFTDERFIQFIGSRGKATIRRFKGSQLGFEDILIVPGSSMPINRTLQIAKALTMASLGIYNSADPKQMEKNKRELARLVGLESVAELTADELDARNADNENIDILEGLDDPIVRKSDNDEIHIDRHYLFLKGSELRNLPPDVGRAKETRAENHIAAHMDSKLQKEANTGLDPATLAAIAAEKQGLEQPQAAGQPMASAPDNSFGPGAPPMPELGLPQSGGEAG